MKDTTDTTDAAGLAVYGSLAELLDAHPELNRGILGALSKLSATPTTAPPAAIRAAVACACLMRADLAGLGEVRSNNDAAAFLDGAHAALIAAGLGDEWEISPVAGLMLRVGAHGLDSLRQLVARADATT